MRGYRFAVRAIVTVTLVMAADLPRQSLRADDVAQPVAIIAPAEALEMTPEREAAALKFAELHHEELVDLLGRLRMMNPVEYQNAIRDLYQSSERLARMKERSVDRYELELSIWKIDSRSHLLVARLAAEENATLRDELRSLLSRKRELRAGIIELERARIVTRLDRLDRDLAELRTNDEAAVDLDMQRLLKAARGRTKPKEPTRVDGAAGARESTRTATTRSPRGKAAATGDAQTEN
ncbi:MAG: hypothetical protein R3B90_14840 [Planctomycetaceae bacterium]